MRHVDDYEMLRLKNGGRFDYWITHVSQVAEFVKDHKLQPIIHEGMLAGGAPQARNLKLKEPMPEYRIPWPFPYPGGIRVAHLHLGDDIYLLNPKQWQEFTKKAFGSFREKLQTTGIVNYGDFMGLTEAMGPIISSTEM